MTSYYLNNVVFGFARSYCRRWSSSYVVMRLTIVILLYVCGGLGKGPKLCNVHCTVPFQACHTRIFPAQKYPPRPILGAKNGPPGPPLVSQKWSSLANSGPSRTNLATKTCPVDHFWQPKLSTGQIAVNGLASLFSVFDKPFHCPVFDCALFLFLKWSKMGKPMNMANSEARTWCKIGGRERR